MPPTEKEWDPTQELDDKELEEEVQSKSKARARLDYLVEQNKAKIKKEKKKGSFDI